MDMVFDKNEWSAAAGLAEDQAGVTRPEWHGLRARLQAGCEASRAFAFGSTDNSLKDRGSFDTTTALRLHAFQALSRGINLKDSANRKPARDNERDVVGESITGERGKR